MATNRFTDITPSVYTPQSLEELAFVPLLKRKKHDEVLAQQELVRAGLAKVDPYDKHFDEAVRLKQDIESNIDKTALQLSQTGINNDMIGKTIALNRQYQDLVAPTGKLGQINAEKQNILKLNDEYDKLGEKNGWSQETTDYWKNKALAEYNSKPIYDESGRILKYNGAKDQANKVDYTKYLHDLASSAKMSTEEFSKGIAGVGTDVNGYHTIVRNSTGFKRGDNYDQVEAAYKTLERELNDPTSEVSKSMRYERRDPNSLLQTLNTQKGIYKQSMSASESDMSINPFGSGPDDSGIEEVSSEGVVSDTKEVGAVAEEYNVLDNIGKPVGSKIKYVKSNNFNPVDAGSGDIATTIESGKTNFSYKDIKDPLTRARYKTIYDGLIDRGVLLIHLNLNHHF